jgi:hypothetical protein
LSELVRYGVGSAGGFVVEVDQPQGDGYRAPVARNNGISDFGQRIETNLDDIRNAAKTTLSKLRDSLALDEIVMRFGIKMTAEAGAIIARTAIEGNFEVQLTWRRGGPDDGTLEVRSP